MTWVISVPILVLLGLSVLELGPMYATDRQTDVRRQTKASLNVSALWGGGIIISITTSFNLIIVAANLCLSKVRA